MTTFNLYIYIFTSKIMSFQVKTTCFCEQFKIFQMDCMSIKQAQIHISFLSSCVVCIISGNNSATVKKKMERSHILQGRKMNIYGPTINCFICSNWRKSGKLKKLRRKADNFARQLGMIIYLRIFSFFPFNNAKRKFHLLL